MALYKIINNVSQTVFQGIGLCSAVNRLVQILFFKGVKSISHTHCNRPRSVQESPYITDGLLRQTFLETPGGSWQRQDLNLSSSDVQMNLVAALAVYLHVEVREAVLT